MTRRAAGEPINKVQYAARASRAIAVEPYEGLQRVMERVSEWRDNRRLPSYRPNPGWERDFHGQLGAPCACLEREAFEPVWASALASLRARGLAVGRGAFGGWDDGDPALARAAWCAVRHLRPEVAVETGVARGLTTQVILEALERNGRGRLWSIDLPPLLEHGLAQETAAAVRPERRDLWTLLRGSSRRLLRGLVADHGRVDLFVHDSMHTTRNVRFELDALWPALAPGGVVLVDDIDRNIAFGAFAAAHPEAWGTVCEAQDGRALFGVLVRTRS